MRLTHVMMFGRNKYKVLNKYRHPVGEDTEVWNRFIKKFPDRFDSVDYYVKVGQCICTFPTPNLQINQWWPRCDKKIIDVVAWKGNVSTIIEVKKKYTVFTLGHIIGYRYLYLREHPQLQFAKTLIVCTSIEQEDIYHLNHHGVDFAIV